MHAMADSHTRIQNELLNLVKTPGDPAQKARNAGKILGINQTELRKLSYEHPTKSTVHDTILFSPKAEWVLRWLWRKMKVDEKESREYRLHDDIWLLVWAVLDRVSTKDVARLVVEHKFLSTLSDSLNDVTICADRDDGLGFSTARCLRSESSSTLQESPILSPVPRGTKRKRGDDQSKVATDATPNPVSNVGEVLLSILLTTSRIVRRATSCDIKEEIALQQLVSALKVDPEILARILGRAFHLVSGVIASRIESESSAPFVDCVADLVRLWDMQSSADSIASSSAFLNNCARPALELIQALRSSRVVFKDFHKDLVKMLERLLACHVILPARQTYLRGMNEEKAQKKGDSSQAVLVSVLDSLNPVRASEDSDTMPRKSMFGPQQSKSIPLLLDIALKISPRRTLKQRSQEGPWLETLFVALAELEGFPIESRYVAHDFPSVAVLEDLLEIAIEQHMELSLKVLFEYASKYSRVLDPTAIRFLEKYDSQQAPCEWNLLAKVVRLGVDVFVPNSGVQNSEYLLQAAFKKATSLRFTPSDLADEYYKRIKIDFIIPVMKGFARSRSLEAFVDLWHAQLEDFATTFGEKTVVASSVEFPLWESEDLLTEFSNLVPSSFTPRQIQAQCSKAVTALNSPTFDCTPRSWQWVVIVDALVRANFNEDDQFPTQFLLSLIETVSSIIDPSKTNLHRWRLWRILRSINGWLPSVFDTGDSHGDTLSSFRAQAHSRTVTGLSQSATQQDWRGFSETLEAFQYMLTPISQRGAVVKLDPDVVSFLILNLGEIAPSKQSSASFNWHGNYRLLDSKERLSITCALNLVRRPRFLLTISSPTRQDFFRALCALVRDSKIPSQNVDLVGLFLRNVATDENMTSLKAIWNDLVEVQLDHGKQHGLGPTEVDFFLSIHPKSISRSRRDKMLDLAYGDLSKPQMAHSYPPIPKNKLMHLMVLMLPYVSSNARIVSDGKTLCDLIGMAMTVSVDWDSPSCALFETLSKEVLNAVQRQPESRKKEYFNTFLNHEVLCLKYLEIHDNLTGFQVSKVFIPWLWSHRESVVDQSLHEKLKRSREIFAMSIVDELERIGNSMAELPSPQFEFRVRNMVESLDLLKDVFAGSNRVPVVASSLLAHLLEHRVASSLSADDHQDRVRTEMVIEKLLFEAGKKSLAEILAKQMRLLSLMFIDIETEQKLVQETKKIMSTQDQGEVLNFLRSIAIQDVKLPSRMLVLGIGISCIPGTSDKTSTAYMTLSSLFSDLASYLPEAPSIEDFCLTVDCLDLILRLHPRAISQWNLENALAAISIVTSRSTVHFAESASGSLPQCAGRVFSRLCVLMRSILLHHRKRLGGRFHLVVTSLQSLLRCLFAPEARGAATRQSVVSPLFVNQGNQVLHEDHASQFSRLLTTVCDPTVSSVQKSSPQDTKAHLTDETKKARGAAGQYLQYIIREYAQCQLSGRATPEIQGALMPGLYSILDAMTREGMHAMNAAMDPSSRAVFKGLYDDYKRFGKWDQS